MGINRARNVFLEEVVKKIQNDEDIMIVSADLAAPVLDSMRTEYPERYVSVGIAEQNLITVAAGLVLEGRKVIAYAANPFLVTRAYDQIRNLVSVMDIPLCMVGVGAGINIPEYGVTHYVTEDMALMGLCPNIAAYSVSDISLAKWLGEHFTGFKCPTYLRFDRLTEGSYDCQIGNPDSGIRRMNSGKKTAIVTTGNLGLEIWKDHSAEIREKEMVYLDVYRFPVNESVFLEECAGIEKIITVEENNSVGGLGGQVASILEGRRSDIQLVTKGIEYGGCFPDFFGDREYFLEYFGLDWESIRKEI